MRNPDRHYQRFVRASCRCESTKHGHGLPCGSRRYVIVHHRDHARQDQSPENLITLCSSCHRKEHREQHVYHGRSEHADWARKAREEMQGKLLDLA